MNTDDIVWRVSETVLASPGFCAVTGEYRFRGDDYHQVYIVDLRDQLDASTHEYALLRAMNKVEVALLRAVQTATTPS